MKTLGKFMRNTGIMVVILFVATIFNPIVMTRADEYSLVIQFGKAARVEKAAGPSLKVPFPQSVQKIPRYKMISDLYPSDVATKDKKVMTVNSSAVWDINDPVRYLLSLSANKEKAEVRLGNVIYDSIKNMLSSTNQTDIVSDRDGDLAKTMADSIGSATDSCGIRIYIVETRKLDLPDSSKESVYQRMIPEQNSIAARYTAGGDYRSSLIKNGTGKTVKETIAKTDVKVKKVKAKSKAKYMRILSEVYNDESRADFYSYVHSLDALRASLKGDNKTVILNQDSELTRMLPGN